MKKTAWFIILMMAISIFVSCSVPEESDINEDSTPESEISENSDNSTDGVSDDEDLEKKINDIFATIFKDDSEREEKEIIAEFPDEFSTIVSFGQDATTILDKIINDKDNSMSKIYFAMYVKYKIDPEPYEIEHISPDKKYIVKATPDSFVNI